MTDRIVLIGAGQAAAQAIETLRRHGFAGELILVGDEAHLPYQRPPLSKKYLAGALERDRLMIRHEAYYHEHRVDLRLRRRAVAIERAARRVRLDDGSEIPYERLVLATGSRARRLEIPGGTLAGLYYLRSIADADALRAEARRGRRALVVGGGYIGLEVAATCRDLGVEVTVLETADRVMNRVVGEPVSRFYEREHAAHGVRILLGTRPQQFLGSQGRVHAVACADGTQYPADFAVIGIGVLAEDTLAQAAGLDCANGILVDEYGRTSDPTIHAIGDCTNHPSVHYGTRVRLESVDNAFEQATSVARDILGTPTRHDKVPWFWSDQYDLKMVIVGLSQGHDEVVLRGDPGTRSFSLCYLRQGELIAVDTINSAKDQMAARRLIAARAHVDRSRLADAAHALKDCATASMQDTDRGGQRAAPRA